MGQRASTAGRIALLWTLAPLTVGLVVLASAERAAACSCVGVSDQEAVPNADAVFTGTLVDIITPTGAAVSSADPERFVFDVDEVFKGEVSARQSVVTARDGASCGLEITGSGPFVVFARTETDGITTGAVDGELYSSLCSGARPLVNSALPAGLVVGAPPNPAASAIGGDEDRAPFAAWGVVGVAALAALTVAGLSIRRRVRSST